MRRFRRWVFNGLTVLSLLLCVATAVLWVRSYYRADVIVLSSIHDDPATISRLLYVPSNIGGLDIEYSFLAIKPGRYIQKSAQRLLEMQQLQEYQGVPRWQTLTPWRGLGYWHTLVRFRYSWLPNVTLPAIPELAETRFNLAFPYWVPALLLTVLPAVHVLLALHRRSIIAQVGKCLHCGYDLRATPDRCPECGTVVKKT